MAVGCFLQASNDYDEVMHQVRWHGVNARAVLEPSPGYHEKENVLER